jgi:hypothetical protein
VIPEDAKYWSEERIIQEIANRRQEYTSLCEAIRLHEEEYDRFPEGGFGGADLYASRNQVDIEIHYLTELL